MNHDYRVFEIKRQNSGALTAIEVGHGQNWATGLIICSIQGSWFVLQPTGRHDLSNALRLIEHYEEDRQFVLHKPAFYDAAKAA
jgi:hypothetical protein